MLLMAAGGLLVVLVCVDMGIKQYIEENFEEEMCIRDRDKDSEGLLIMTNDGELINSMMRARYHHEKEYHVRVDKEITSEFVRQMSEGVHIQDVEDVYKRQH